MNSKILSVTQINNLLARYIDQNQELKNVSIKGEIGNFSQSKVGHIYFNLKDQNAIISVNVWKSLVMSFSREVMSSLKEGSEVIVTGNIQIYEKGGTINLIATKIELGGEGDLFKKFQLLKTKLENLGFFDPSHKKPIPRFNQNVGVITAATGAVIQDIQSTIKRRFPNINLYLYNVSVQGINAENDIIQALRTADKQNHDVILLARGGGSLEDLWTFNSELIAIEIYNLNTPIISAIGHETDFTISDFVADLRAATPTAGAELLNPHYRDVKNEVATLSKNLIQQINSKLMKIKLDINEFDKRLSLIPRRVNELRNNFNSIESKFIQLTNQFVNTNKQMIVQSQLKLQRAIQIQLNETRQNLLKKNQMISSQGIFNLINTERNRLANFNQVLNYKYQNEKHNYKILIEDVSKKLSFAMSNELKNLKHQLVVIEQKLVNINPEELTKKGYIYITKDKHIIRDANDLQVKDEVILNFSKQEVYATIDNIKLKRRK